MYCLQESTKIVQDQQKESNVFLLLQFAHAELGIKAVRKSPKKLVSCGHKINKKLFFAH